MKDIEGELYRLNKMSKKSVALYHKFALSVGISDSALGVLYALLEADGTCSQYDLCNEWCIPKQTINTTVNALKKKGLISLSHICGARNKKGISLTDEGRAFVEKNIDKLRRAELDALSALTAEERDIYVRLNKKYNEELAAKLDFVFNEFED